MMVYLQITIKHKGSRLVPSTSAVLVFYFRGVLPTEESKTLHSAVSGSRLCCTSTLVSCRETLFRVRILRHLIGVVRFAHSLPWNLHPRTVPAWMKPSLAILEGQGNTCLARNGGLIGTCGSPTTFATSIWSPGL